MNKTLGTVLVVILVIATAGVYLYPKVQQYGSDAGPDHYGLQQFFGGFLKGNVLATSTVASMTLKVSDVQDYDTVIVTPTGAASAKTLTFFASSTARSWLPAAGQRQEVCFLNSTTTAATTLVFAAGTGIDMQVATSTNNGGGAYDLTISAGGTGCFTFIRKAATASAFDIEANLLEYSDGD